MALDRLTELQKNDNNGSLHNSKPFTEHDVELGTAFDNDKASMDPSMVEFWSNVKRCQDKLKVVKNNMILQDDMKRGYKKSTLTEKENQMVKDFDELDAKNSKILKEISGTVKDLDIKIKESRENKEDEQLIRMKDGQLNSLTQDLKHTMTKAQEMNLEFQNSVKTKIKRQINHHNDGSLSKEEIDKAVNSNNPEALNQIVQQKLFGKASMSLEYAARDIDEKCKGIEQLGRNIRQLYEMIKEISEIIQAQGEQVNLIAENVNKAHDYVHKGNQNLNKAKEHHQEAKKKQCCIIVVGVAILVVLLTSVLGIVL